MLKKNEAPSLGIRFDEELPPEGVTVMTKIDDARGVRNEQRLRRSGSMLFGGGMYVYYQPTHWCHLDEEE